MAEKLTLAPNVEYTIKGMYDKPFIGLGQWGEYYNYTVEHEGIKKSLNYLKEYQMKCLESAGFKTGVVLTIKNVQEKPKGKVTFKVKDSNNKVFSSDTVSMEDAIRFRDEIINATAMRDKDFDASKFPGRNPNGTLAPQNAPGSTQSTGAVQSINSTKNVAYNGAQMTKADWEAKEMRIGKQALAKSMIETGYKPSEQTKKDFDWWFEVITKETFEEGRKDLESFKQKNEPEIPEPTEEDGKEEVKIEDIAF